MWYIVIIINVIKTGECVVLCLGIGMLVYVVKLKGVILCSGLEGYCVGGYSD